MQIEQLDRVIATELSLPTAAEQVRLSALHKLVCLEPSMPEMFSRDSA